jgi:hypothetical protein
MSPPVLNRLFLAFITSEGHAFRQDGRYFVLAERHKSKDTIGVYDTADSFRLARVGLYFH